MMSSAELVDGGGAGSYIDFIANKQGA
jgi:hypothetical protein